MLDKYRKVQGFRSRFRCLQAAVYGGQSANTIDASQTAKSQYGEENIAVGRSESGSDRKYAASSCAWAYNKPKANSISIQSDAQVHMHSLHQKQLMAGPWVDRSCSAYAHVKLKAQDM
jgi:hypothetical protein